jgi:hypothetical protein
MLSRRNQDSLLHQAGSVADAGNISADSLDWKTVEVDAVKHNAGARWGGQDSQMNRSATVQSDSGALHSPTNCLLVSQPSGSLNLC